MPGPIKPSEVDKTKTIPEAVFEVFNHLIIEHWNGNEAVLSQEEVVARAAKALGCERHVLFSRHYLDVEDAYRKVGWDVSYDKPGYSETGPAIFTFRRTKKQ